MTQMITLPLNKCFINLTEGDVWQTDRWERMRNERLIVRDVSTLTSLQAAESFSMWLSVR